MIGDGLSQPLSTDADALSGRECTSGDAHNKGDSGDEIGDIRSRSPVDLGDNPDRPYLFQNSNVPVGGDSCTDDL